MKNRKIERKGKNGERAGRGIVFTGVAVLATKERLYAWVVLTFHSRLRPKSSIPPKLRSTMKALQIPRTSLRPPLFSCPNHAQIPHPFLPIPILIHIRKVPPLLAPIPRSKVDSTLSW